MILALLFNSLLKPFIVLVIIPFTLVGVALAYFTHGIPIYGLFGLLGILGLFGIVVNSTIVMMVKFDAIPIVAIGHEYQIIAATAKTRLRAIIMTTVTTVLGLFPTAYGIAGYDFMLAEMMFVMAWGLIFSTLITLVLVPLLYTFYFKHKNRKANLV